ncbi:MAG: TonB-dependent receptor [Flavobacteriales bacterium]|nr:TonB-dependent receptor [Flavobacteriales bacterium]
MKNIFLFTILIMVNFVIKAQSIKGKVIDAQTKESIPGVNIYLPEIKKGVVSDSNGEYTLKFPRKGVYKLQVSFIGYDIILQEIEIDAVIFELNFELIAAVIETKEFVVSSVYHSSQDENPIEVIQFDAKQLQQSAAPTLMQSLSNIAGVSMIESGVGNSKPVIRGLSNNRVLVYSQGMPFDNQQWGDDHSLGLNELGIDKVEIIKGPSSLIYGADAMGGVLHFVSEKPAPVKMIKTYVGSKYFSNTDGYVNIFGVKGTREYFRFGLNAGYSMHSDYKQSSSIYDKQHLRVTNTRFNERAIRANIGFITKPWVTDITYSYSQAAIGIYEEQSFQNYDKAIMIPFQLTTSNVLSMENSFFFGESKVTLNLGYQNNDRKEFEDEHAHEAEEEHDGYEEVEYFKQKLIYNLQDTGALDMNLKTYNYDVKWFIPSLNKLDIVLGAQGKIQSNKNRGHEVLIPDAEITQHGIFSLFKFKLKKINFLSGVRSDIKSIKTYETEAEDHEEEGGHVEIESISTSFGAVNGSFGMTYQLDSAWLIRTNVATGFRAPNLAELTSNGVHHGALRYELGNVNLTTENNVELDLGTEFSREHVSIAISGFYNHINNFIYLESQDSIMDGVQLYSYTQTDANLYGFETTIDIHPHVMHWLHFETQYAMVVGKKSDGSYLPRIPGNSLLNTLKAEIKDFSIVKNPFVTVGVNTIFEQNNIDVNETKTLTYVLINASIGAEIVIGKQAFEFTIGATNLFDRKYFNHLSRLKQKGIYNMGRNFVVGIKIPFDIKQK